ncbi:transcriptional regulator [Capsulimonas corticalis]|uniref:Transcriptional regulator n=1 Tax=Capsulimonas corticalis TaxID=2219043 RepID=A0A402CUD1_9BACT|nr:helix-turn-helix transcriptional regulator [Capsulimonas corticalis]BDI28924.1 transcriptional regulator [Capsulimonas corticalis]
MIITQPPVGEMLREWRQRRRMSQLDLAFEADISSRHLSFVETGRAQPSRDMLLHLAERLDVPLRERNTLLVAGGYAPVFAERELADPAMDAVRGAIELVLTAHEPYPALAVDRHWTMRASNASVALFWMGVDPALLQPPVNILRMAVHPNGLSPRIANYRQWRSLLMARLRQQIAATADPFLIELVEEIQSYPEPPGAAEGPPANDGEYAGIVTPLQITTDEGILSFFSTTTVFGTPVDITLSELAIEAFFPADARSAAILQQLAAHQK